MLTQTTEFDYWRNPVTGLRNIHITISDDDILDLGSEFFRRNQIEFSYFNRENSTIEDKLMALQLIAKGLHESIISSEVKPLIKRLEGTHLELPASEPKPFQGREDKPE